MSDNGKVCPSCGCEPWNFAEGENPKVEGTSRDSSEQRKQPAFCQDCGDKLIRRSELPRDIWKDPYVKEALKSGRQTFDVQCLRCPECNDLGYYNEGSSFSCRFCDRTFRVDEEMIADSMVSLADTVTEATDGYHNQTL
jgi:hypothetical protein